MRRLLTALLLLMSCATLWAADNAVILTPGTGVTMRSIDIGAGVQSSAVILGSSAGAAIYGTAGTANANVLTIQGIASGTTVPVTGTITAVTTVTSLSQFAGAAINLGAGAVGTGTLRITQASDSPEISALGAVGDSAYAGSGNASIIAALKGLYSGVTGAIPAGANLIGSVTGSGTAGTAASGVVTVQGIASMTKLLVTPDSVALPANQSVNVSQINGVTPLMGNGVTGTGSPRITLASDGTAISTTGYMSVKLDQTTPGTTNAIRTIAGATGGGTISSAIAPATPAGVNLKASAGSLFRVFGTTIQSTPVYIKFYNASSAPTCGSGTPVGRFMIPSASTAANGAGSNIDIGDIGAAFGTGIGYCVTGALADADTTAITANNTLVNIVWN